jgi:hypothetical protein
MRPEDRRVGFDDLMDAGMDLPFDADLESLDQELADSGEHARRMLYGKTQPTRVFTNELRTRLVGAMSGPVAMAVATPIAVPILAPAGAGAADGGEVAMPLVSGETRPATAGGTVTHPAGIPMRVVLAMLTAVGLLIVAALGGSFELLLR